MPTVSIIIPVYNRAATLPRAVASVQAQDFTDWELILVDDGSTDGGVESVFGREGFGPDGGNGTDPRLRRIRHPVNRGAPAARNTGIAAARGALIAFLDSDDEWLPGKLSAQVAALAGAPARVGALVTGFVLHRQATGGRFERVPAADGTWFATLLDGCTLSPGSTLLARRACFEQIGPFAEDLPRFEDWDWLLRLIEVRDLDCLPQMGAVVHLGGFAPRARVAEAAALLWRRQRDRVGRLGGPGAQRRLRASLALECAVAAWRTGAPGSAVIAGLAAATHSPARVARLLGRGWQRLGQRDL
jgi:glycosyltransferase involved in cell wall biosynthesis